MTVVSDDVKPRRYRSEHRSAQAEQTRRRVIEAAATLFAQSGYEGTSIAAIAEQARVSQETVYARFQNKRRLLGELVQRAVRGEDPAPILEQPGPRAVAAAGDQHDQLRLFATDIGSRLERVAPLVAIVAGAARSEPELADLLGRLHATRRENLRNMIDALAANAPLRPTRDQAVDTTWALTSPELHQLLTHTRGWTPEHYRDWLAESLTRLLLNDTPHPP